MNDFEVRDLFIQVQEMEKRLKALENKGECCMTDEEVVEWHVFQRVKEGCRECGDNNYGYNAGVNYESNLKWYIIEVHCGACDSRYEEILEVRVINEPNENDESE